MRRFGGVMVHQVDQKQRPIVEGLRAIGATVDTSWGKIDAIVGRTAPCPHCQRSFKQNFLMEIKNDEKSPFTKSQKKFFETWRGQVARVHILEEAYAVLGVTVGRI